MHEEARFFAAISFFVIGFSHLGRPQAWIEFYRTLAAWGTTGAFLEGFLILNFGAIIVAFHNVWDGPAVVLTLVGWAQVLKGLGRFVFPQIGLQVMQRASRNGTARFRLGGVVALALSAFAWWLRFRPA